MNFTQKLSPGLSGCSIDSLAVPEAPWAGNLGHVYCRLLNFKLRIAHSANQNQPVSHRCRKVEAAINRKADGLSGLSDSALPTASFTSKRNH